MLTALTRPVSRSITRCELTHLPRFPIDLPTAQQQHTIYEDTLRSLGVKVISLPEEPDMPDAVFVEDTAIVLEECAVLTRPGAATRQPEVKSVAYVLSAFRTLIQVQAPGTLDGGDVLVVGKTVWIGIGSRTNVIAVDQVEQFLHPHGYSVHAVPVRGCLHLKSAVTQAAENILLINPDWVEKSEFPGYNFIEVDPAEHQAANILLVGDRAICQPVFPRTLARLRSAGIQPLLVDASELGKAEGALTCCSLLFDVHLPGEHSIR